MKIALIGFMCSGKSTAGKLLAEKLNYQFIETDQLLVGLSSRSTITEIFEQDGEPCMRDLESKAILQTAALDNVVISTGGGAVMRQKNVESLKKNHGAVIYLKTSFDELKGRLAGDRQRPLFKDPVAAATLYEQRLPIYKAAADITVTTDSKNVDKIVDEILKFLKLI